MSMVVTCFTYNGHLHVVLTALKKKNGLLCSRLVALQGEDNLVTGLMLSLC